MDLKNQASAPSNADRALEVIFNLNCSERDSYEQIVEADEPLTARDLTESMDYGLASAYRYIDRLHGQGLLEEANTEESGSGAAAYVAKSPDQVAQEIHREVDAVYEQCREAIDSCRRELASRSDSTVSDERSGPENRR